MPAFRIYALGMIYGMWPTCAVCTTIYTQFLYYFTVVCYSPFDFVSIWFAVQCATTCISRMWATCHNDVKLCVCVKFAWHKVLFSGTILRHLYNTIKKKKMPQILSSQTCVWTRLHSQIENDKILWWLDYHGFIKLFFVPLGLLPWWAGTFFWHNSCPFILLASW